MLHIVWPCVLNASFGYKPICLYCTALNVRRLCEGQSSLAFVVYFESLVVLKGEQLSAFIHTSLHCAVSPT